MNSRVNWAEGQRRGFTLIELLAVVLIICILAGILIAISQYAMGKVAVGRARAQMAALEIALEAYREDVGYYPVSTWERYNGNGDAELSNAWYLYRALTQTNKVYYNTRTVDVYTIGSFPYFKDPWGNPWNYYRPVPPQPVNLVVVNINGSLSNKPSYAYGGQVNQSTYDLFSFGPDGCTYIPGSTGGYNYWRWYSDQTQPQHANDDITNWGK